MNDQNESSYPSEVTHPRETQQRNCCQMMDKHLPEILPLRVKSLCDKQAPVECSSKNIVPPHIIWNTLQYSKIYKFEILHRKL